MARFVRVTFRNPLTRHEVEVCPFEVTYRRAEQGYAGSQNSIMSQFVLPKLREKYPQYGATAWWSDFARIEVEVFDGPPRRRWRSGSKVAPVATADGNPACRCDQPGRCPVHDA